MGLLSILYNIASTGHAITSHRTIFSPLGLTIAGILFIFTGSIGFLQGVPDKTLKRHELTQIEGTTQKVEFRRDKPFATSRHNLKVDIYVLRPDGETSRIVIPVVRFNSLRMPPPLGSHISALIAGHNGHDVWELAVEGKTSIPYQETLERRGQELNVDNYYLYFAGVGGLVLLIGLFWQTQLKRRAERIV